MKGDLSTYEKLSKYKSETTASSKPSVSSEKTKIAVDPTEKRDLARLVDYYRMKIETFEKERLEYLSLLDSLKIKNEDQHKTEWELRRRKEEIVELEQALYEANITLNNERKKAIHYSNEIENCKLRKKEDHRRIKQLLQLAEPIEQTMKLYQGKPPVKTEKYSNFNFEPCNDDNEYFPNSNSVSIKKALKPKETKSKSRPKSSYYSTKTGIGETKTKKTLYRIPPSDEKQQILRTVMFPTDEKVTEINTENTQLKKEIEELKAKFDAQILKLEENRKLNEEEFRQQVLNYNREAEDLIKKNQKLEKLNYEIAKDYMLLKHETGIQEKKIYEDMEVIKLNNKALEQSLKEIVDKSHKEKITSLNEFNKRTREITSCLRGQARTQEENANIIKEQYKQIQKIYTSKVKSLTEQLKTLGDKCKLLESRKNLDIEGYINEIGLMKKRLKSYQDYAKKIQNIASYQPMHEGLNQYGESGNNYYQSGEMNNEEYNQEEDKQSEGMYGTRSMNNNNMEQIDENENEQRSEEDNREEEQEEEQYYEDPNEQNHLNHSM